jgi:hypothetical protein
VSSFISDGDNILIGGNFALTGDQITGPFTTVPAAIGPTVPDTTPPTITVRVPSSGQHFALNAQAQADFSCSDTGLGVQTCDGPTTVDTSTAGSHVFTVHATDKAGNPATATVQYVVDTPVDTGPTTTNTTTGGGTTNTTPTTPSLPPATTPTAPVVDRLPPTVVLSGPRQQRPRSELIAGVTCHEPCTVVATSRLRLGHRSLRLPTKQTALGSLKIALSIKLSRAVRTAIRRALKAHQRVSVQVTITATDQSGNARRQRWTILLQPAHLPKG